jgi:hypothetical protein
MRAHPNNAMRERRADEALAARFDLLAAAGPGGRISWREGERQGE